MNDLLASLNRAVEAWWPWVLHTAWQAALVGLVLWGLVRWGRRWPAPLRHGLLVVALVKFMVPPWVAVPVGLFTRLTPAAWLNLADPSLIAFRSEPAWDDESLPDGPWKEHWPPPEHSAGSTQGSAGPALKRGFTAMAPPPSATGAAASSGDPSVPRADAAQSRGPSRPSSTGPVFVALASLSWKAWLMVLHIVGTASLAAWTLWQMRLLCRVVRDARAITDGPLPRQLQSICGTLHLARVPRLLRSTTIVSPVAFGVWRPTVMVPGVVLDRLSDHDVETVLAHESAHLRRHDVWINWLQIALCAVWWFHPVIWLLGRALRSVREDCCDDILLARGVTRQADYCETLLRVASHITSGATVGATLGMAHRLHPLGRRLTRIMDGAVRRRARLSLGGLAFLGILACLLLPGLNRPLADAIQADEPRSAAATAETDDGVADQPEEAGVAGVVLDADVKPVAGATVWMLGESSNGEPPPRRTETVTDGAGRFRFRDVSLDEFKTANAQRLLARDVRHRIGWPRLFSAEGAQSVQIRLRDVADFRGTVLDASGRPIAGARVTPLRFTTINPHYQVLDSGELFPELVRDFEAETAGDGSFVLRHVPEQGSVTARIAAKGFGVPLVTWDLDKALTMRLDRAGGIAGAVAPPEGAVLNENVELKLWRQSEKASSKDQGFDLTYTASATPAADGSFSFVDVPPGSYTITPQIDVDVPLYGDATGPILVRPGEVISGIELPLRRSITVRGQVVDKQSRQPMVDVEVQIYSLINETNHAPGATMTTDADGRFTAYVRPGSLIFKAMTVPEGYLATLEHAKLEPIEADGDVEPVIEIERAIQVAGVVVDPAGAPVPDAEFHLLLPNRGRRFYFLRLDRADAAGRFILKDIDPADVLALRVRSATAVTAGEIVLTPEQLKEPIRLVVDEAHACRLRGRLVDELDAPIAHATVRILTTRMYQSRRVPQYGTSVQVARLETDDDGTFETTALWSGDRYQAVVAVEGYTRAESARVAGVAGETRDLGTMVLRRNDAFVAGRVVDTAGRPVAGVNVFNSGDGVQPFSMATAATGQFRLEGLFRAPAYIFARKTGYRFTGLRVAANSVKVEVTLRRGDEPPPADQPSAPRDSAQHELLARWMLARFWELPPPAEKGLFVRYMARIDREQARQWAAQLGGQHERQVALGIADRLDDDARQPDVLLDAEKAIASLAGLSDEQTYDALQSLAEHTLPHSPENSWRFAVEALARVRDLAPPQRSASMAQLGDLLLRLGLDDAGRKLLNEAADAAEQVPANGRQLFVRGRVAVALAKYDLPRATQLIEPIVDPHERAHYLSLSAEALAEHDVEAALAIAELIKGDQNASWRQNLAKLKIAYRIAATRPDEALRIVETMTGDGGLKTQAEALGWIAVAVAPHDHRTACELIDRSLAIYLDHPEAFMSMGNYGGRTALAAWIVRQAREVGYPDMNSVVMRVLATRPTMREEFDPIRRLEATTAMALVLGFSVPETSRQVLNSITPMSELIGSGHSSIGRREWIEAWALTDPERAKKVFLDELQAVQDKPNHREQESGLIYVVDLLTRPRSQWPRHWREHFGVIWYPGED